MVYLMIPNDYPFVFHRDDVAEAIRKIHSDKVKFPADDITQREIIHVNLLIYLMIYNEVILRRLDRGAT